MISVSFCYLFQTINKWMERSKHGFFVFPPKKTLIWRRHCSIGQSCYSMTSKSKQSIIFSPELNQPKATRVCIRSINQSNRSISVRLLFLFCSRVFISRSYENRSNPTLKTNHYDLIRLQLERNYEFDDDGYARYQSLFRKRARARLLSWRN